MRPLTEAELRASFVNTTEDEVQQIEMPPDFLLIDWDYLDFFAWRDPASSKRACIALERDGHTVAITLRSSDPSRTRSGMCNICHTMQPGNQVSLFTAVKAGEAGRRGDSVGTYMCADVSCHDSVRLAHPLAPSEVRTAGQIDFRLDGTRRRMEQFVNRVFDGVDDVASTRMSAQERA